MTKRLWNKRFALRLAITFVLMLIGWILSGPIVVYA